MDNRRRAWPSVPRIGRLRRCHGPGSNRPRRRRRARARPRRSRTHSFAHGARPTATPRADRDRPRTGRRPVQAMVPIRHDRMAVSPFTFLCGAAAVMAADLAGTPTSGITVQLCGDAHLGNFGGFAAPGRRMVFDVDDFDETLPARGSGTSSGSRRARRSRRASGASPRRTARTRCARRSWATRRRCGASPGCGRSTSGTPVRRSMPACGSGWTRAHRHGRRRSCGASRRRGKDSCAPGAAHRDPRWRPDRPTAVGRAARRAAEDVSSPGRPSPRDRPPAARVLPRRRHRPQDRRRRQRGQPGMDRPAARARRRRPARPAAQGGRAVGVEPHLGRYVSDNAAAAWSTASG